MRKIRTSNLELHKGLSHELETGYGLKSDYQINQFVKSIDSRFMTTSEYMNETEIIFSESSNFDTNEINGKWEQVIEYLHQNDFKPTYRQGVHQSGHHIHIDVKDLTPIQIANIYTSIYQYQDIILLAVPLSRFNYSANDGYVSRMTKRQAEQMYELAKAWKAGRLGELEFKSQASRLGKYCILSTNRLYDLGTLEFRAFGLPLVNDLDESKDRFFFNGQFFSALVNYFKRFKGLQKVTSDDSMDRLTVGNNSHLEKSKPNRFSKGYPKDFSWSFQNIFGRSGCECERTSKHMIDRVKKTLGKRKLIDYPMKNEWLDIIDNFTW